MYHLELFLQADLNRGAIHRGLLRTATSAYFDRLVVAVAYISKTGCQDLIESFQTSMPQWKQMEKRWLVSFDHGISEPDALEYLAGLPNSLVRIPNAESVLRVNLRPRVRFHNKLFLFDCQDEQGAVGLFSGSANLSFSALHLNNEQATASIWIPPLSKSERSHLALVRTQRKVIDQIFESASPLDKSLLERYTALRPERTAEDQPQVVERIIEEEPVLPRDNATALALASAFWLEINYVVKNRGKYLPGNQIDLQRGSRVFFGFGVGNVPRNTHLGTVWIRLGKVSEFVECSMRFGNNQMDKLNLPISDTHEPNTYENQTLLFRRHNNREDSFDLCIGSAEEIAQWKARSSRQGTLFRMQSGREYGVF